jgi:hypothetical protein
VLVLALALVRLFLRFPRVKALVPAGGREQGGMEPAIGYAHVLLRTILGIAWHELHSPQHLETLHDLP